MRGTQRRKSDVTADHTPDNAAICTMTLGKKRRPATEEKLLTETDTGQE